MLSLKQGYEVSGSDIAWSSFMDGLQEAGARIHIGHSVSNLRKKNSSRLPNAVVVSSAIPQDNVEILYANSAGVPVYKRDCWLEKLTHCYNLTAVSGTHGKSTTASMLTYVLRAMGDDLTAIIGAHVPQFAGKNVLSGDSQTFVLEAVKNSFRIFLNWIRMGGHLILCGDSKQESGSDASFGTMSIQSVEQGEDHSYKITTYGITSSNEWHASSISLNSMGGTGYTLNHWGSPVADICLQIPGLYNVLNSLAVIATTLAYVSDESEFYKTINHLKMHLKNFKGISRRFEMIGKIHGCHIYDDYAHHPTEVHAVLQAARQRFPIKNLVVVYQPHMYSRLAALKDDFASALSDADQVIFTAVYAARETNLWNVNGRELAASIVGPPSEYIPSLEAVVEKLVVQICKEPHRDIVVLTLGAGDIPTVGPKLLNELWERFGGNSM